VITSVNYIVGEDTNRLILVSSNISARVIVQTWLLLVHVDEGWEDIGHVPKVAIAKGVTHRIFYKSATSWADKA